MVIYLQPILPHPAQGCNEVVRYCGAFRGALYPVSIPPRQLEPQVIHRLCVEIFCAVFAQVEVLRGCGERVFCAVGEAVAVEQPGLLAGGAAAQPGVQLGELFSPQDDLLRRLRVRVGDGLDAEHLLVGVEHVVEVHALQAIIREKDMPPKPVLNVDMDEFRTMQTLMLKVQKQAKAIKKIQEVTLPNLRQQLAETTGIFKGKERKALEKQIQQTEIELAEKLDKIPDILKDDGYPDVQAFMKTYRKAEAIVTQYNQDLAEWEQTVKNGQKPAEKQHRPPERQSVRNRLRQLQEEGKQNSQPKQRKKSQDRDR